MRARRTTPRARVSVSRASLGESRASRSASRSTVALGFKTKPRASERKKEKATPSLDAVTARRQSPLAVTLPRVTAGAMSTVIETTPLGDVEAETEASRARAARDAEERRERRALEASRRKETRETCERLLTFVRVVATESGRAVETETFGDGNEGLAHRGRLLKLRVRVARVRMQPKRARRPASRVRENGDVRDDGGGLRRQRSLAEMATRNAARLAGRDRGDRERGDGEAASPTPSGYGSDRSFGTTTYSEGETSSRLEDLLALLAHAPYEHESLEDGGRPRGWTGSGSTMSRTGVIRVGVDHQAHVEATTDATFARGTMDAREERYLGTMAWPTTNVVKASSSSPVRAGTRPSALRGTKASTRPEVEEKEETEKKDDVKTEKKETIDEEEDQKGDDEDDATTERRPLVSEEDIAAARRALEENLRRAGVGESLLGLATIGAAGSSARWNEEEKTTFAEHVNKYCDDLFRLCVKLPDKTMRDVVDYYYNVWQVGCKNHGRVDVEGAEEPAHGARGVGRGRGRPRGGAAPKFTSEEVQRERDDKSIQNFVDWIRGVAMNTKRAMLNVHRAPTTARFKGHMMTRWRSVAFDSSDGAKEYLKDLTRRMHAAKFTPEEREAAAKMKAEAKRPGRPPKSAARAAEKRAAAAPPPAAKDSDDATAPTTTAVKRGKKTKTRDPGENAENEKKKPTGKRTANAKKRASDGLKTKDRNFIL